MGSRTWFGVDDPESFGLEAGEFPDDVVGPVCDVMQARTPALEEAARIDGCSRFQAFWHVVLPLATPGLVITALFSFMTAWSEYIVAAQVMQDERMFTLPLGIKGFQASLSSQWGLYAAASILVSIPVVVVFLIFSRYLVNGLTVGSVKE